MQESYYDYAIVGAGAAGLHIALAMLGNQAFATRRILILEKDLKTTNDKTWCYWEKGAGKWDHLVFNTWRKSLFASSQGSRNIDLGSYQYKMIRALDFYEFAKDQISSAAHIDWIVDEVESINVGQPSLIRTHNNQYRAGHVFDSRLDSEFHSDLQHIHLLQHFKGWTIETTKPVFDPESFTMMDFRIKYPDSTSFTYVLPFSQHQALVEFTFFSPRLLSDHEYDGYLNTYIKEILEAQEYEILDCERGTIPMTDYPFHKLNGTQLTKIGTAGSWVKGSSGYSFKNAERYSRIMVNNILNGAMPGKALFKKRFRFYDRLFLDILYRNNHLGEALFTQMYSNADIEIIFAFLDEQTSLKDDLKIINTFQRGPFIKALYRSLRLWIAGSGRSPK